MAKQRYILIYAALVLYIPAMQAQPIKAYEYWFDNDYANRVSETFAQPVYKATFNQAVTTSNLTYGVHTFNIRYKDFITNAPKWSSTLTEMFFKDFVLPAGQSARLITAYEYWFDDNYTARTAETLTTPAATFRLNKSVSAAHLDYGIHRLNVRYKDNVGLWSSTQSEVFFKGHIQPSGNEGITAYTYWYDNNFAGAVTVTLPAPTNSCQTDISLTPDLPVGKHALHFRFKDASGLWSVISTDSIVKVNVSTGMQTEFASNAVKVYPNPTADILNIDLAENAENLKLTLCNSSGQVIKQEQYRHSGNKIRWNMPYNTDIYLLTITGDGIKTTVHILKK